MVSANGEAVSPGLWYFAGTTPQIGAYLPDYSGDLTVYWRGHVGRDEVRNILEETEEVLAKAGESASGKLDAYGSSGPETEQHVGPAKSLSKYFDSSVLRKFEACRAEFTTKKLKVVIWANVSGKETAPLNEGGENIGLSVPQKFGFDGPLRPVIVHAISRTMSLDEKSTISLLESISKAIQQKQLVPGS